jgi:molybdopterin molybdotransferase
MIAVDEARARIVADLRPVGTELVSLADAAGRTLAEPVVARLSRPAATVSSMDGFAVRCADVPSAPMTLPLAGASFAGHPFTGRLLPGTAVKIATGAALPEGADGIVIKEDAAPDGAQVTLLERPVPGRYLRPAGSDFRGGDIGLQAGQVLASRHIALAAAMNAGWLRVRCRPRVGILATGDELVLPGDAAPEAAAVIDVNSLLLAAQLRGFGANPLILPAAADEASALHEALAVHAAFDLLIVTGGTSVGERDLVPATLRAMGARIVFHGIAMRPGKPLLLAQLDATPVLALPGNPVSAAVTALVLARPAIAALLGRMQPWERRLPAVAGCAIAANDWRHDYLRARLDRDGDGPLIATPFPQQDSAQLRTLAGSDCLILRAPHAASLAAGAPVEIIVWPEAG